MQVCPLAGHQGLLQACTSTAGTRDANLPVPLGSPRQPCLRMARVALSPADRRCGGSWKLPALFLRWAVIPAPGRELSPVGRADVLPGEPRLWRHAQGCRCRGGDCARSAGAGAGGWGAQCPLEPGMAGSDHIASSIFISLHHQAKRVMLGLEPGIVRLYIHI